LLILSTVVPWLFGLWLLAFIDRSNIGNARIGTNPHKPDGPIWSPSETYIDPQPDGMATELKLTGTKFNVVLACFYVPYILVDVPSNLVLKHMRAGYYLPALVIAWGVVSMCMGFVQSYTGLIVARIFLGLMEGGLLVRNS
jgi:MFS family permease